MPKRPANKHERAHLDKVASLGCITCRNAGYTDSPAEIHHVTGAGMGLRSDHYMTIPLCPAHHRTGGYGIAVHAGTEAWEARYGTQEALLDQVRGML
ncbi:MAG: hypothetical protein CMM93_07970 [Rickettsiales bacterium]|nr:hypothetical protein [Rickettsiales bacterium]